LALWALIHFTSPLNKDDDMQNLEEKINDLQKRLSYCLPDDPDEDGTFRTDGSHEELLGVFERAYDKAESIAEDAIKLIKEISQIKL